MGFIEITSFTIVKECNRLNRFIGVLKSVMHYGIVSGIEQRKVSWET